MSIPVGSRKILKKMYFFVVFFLVNGGTNYKQYIYLVSLQYMYKKNIILFD